MGVILSEDLFEWWICSIIFRMKSIVKDFFEMNMFFLVFEEFLILMCFVC